MIVVVLHEPQDLVNIAHVVRGMKNFGFRDLRLVAPREYDAHRVAGIAHQTDDVLARVRTFPSLAEALADCVHVVGFTARGRTAKRNVQRPREAAVEITALAEGAEPIGLLVMLYELAVARGADAQPFKPPRRQADPATVEELERLFADVARALAAIDFFKTRNAEGIMRTMRELAHRTPLDGREAKLLRAMAIEVTKYGNRLGR